jgi:uncharacterized membrane protein
VNRRWVPWALTALAFAGFVVATYLTFAHYRGYVSPCYVVHGCESVQTSKYSSVLGVPVALIGAAGFAVLFYLGIGLLTGAGRWTTPAFRLLAFAGALGMIPLFLLQAVVLKAFCSYCILTEVLMLAIWVLTFFLVPAVKAATD